MDDNATVNLSTLPCCPELSLEPCCDVMDMRRRLLFPTTVRDRQERGVAVEVIIHTRFTRCSGPLSLGDIVYSTTLLPGEKVRLATTDRRSRFSFDSETNLSYRSEQMSEEQYRMSALRAIMSDSNSTDNGSSRASDQGAWDFHGDASGGLGFFSVNADSSAHGSHNASSTSEYLREHAAHASMADHMSVEATRKAHSVSVGEVSTRAHQEGESEDHFESSSRQFENPNHCHAVTYLFYRLNKSETIKFELVAIERRVLDPAAPTPVLANPVRAAGQIATIPQEVPATAKARVETQQRALEADALVSGGSAGQTRLATTNVASLLTLQTASRLEPLPPKTRAAALAEVDRLLAEEGLIDVKTGKVSGALVEAISFERMGCLPTAGIVVKGCLDQCDVCEPEVHEKIELDLERMKLENELLKRQIELLDQAQEYRCCPPSPILGCGDAPDPDA